MSSLCDTCGNINCIMQSGIERYSCVLYFKRPEPDQYILIDICNRLANQIINSDVKEFLWRTINDHIENEEQNE